MSHRAWSTVFSPSRALGLAFGLAVMSASPALAKTPHGSRAWGPRIADNTPAAPSRSTVASLLEKSRDLFDSQDYELSIQTLSGVVVRTDATEAERKEAYKILAKNHITLGRSEEADAAVRALYVLDEAFSLERTESPKFREFFDKTKAAWEAEGKPGKTNEGGAPSLKPVTVKHVPSSQVESGSAIAIEGTIDDPEVRAERVAIFFRTGAQGKFTEKELVFSMGSFRGQIPPTAVLPPVVEYYVLALDKAGLPVASRGDADLPLRVIVPEETTSVLESPWFWIPVGVGVVGAAVLTGVLVTQLGQESTVTINVRE